MSDTLFDGETPAVDPEKDYFSELVGEDKRYKDPKAAGRALVEKDNFIEQLKAENSQMRDEITKRAGMEALVDKITASRNTAPNTPENNQNRNEESPQTNKPQPKVEDVVQQALADALAKKQATDNRSKVVDTLRAQWGAGWAKVLAEKAESLGVGQNFVDDLAGRSPQAVFQLVGATETPAQRGQTAPALRTNPGTSQGGKKNFAYYEQLRKTDPTKYFSVRTSQEMMQQATEMGDDFYR